MSRRDEFNSVLKLVEGWPEEERRALAVELSTCRDTLPSPPTPRDTLRQAKAIASKVVQPAPTDEQVKQWMNEHRITKYG